MSVASQLVVEPAIRPRPRRAAAPAPVFADDMPPVVLRVPCLDGPATTVGAATMITSALAGRQACANAAAADDYPSTIPMTGTQAAEASETAPAPALGASELVQRMRWWVRYAVFGGSVVIVLLVAVGLRGRKPDARQAAESRASRSEPLERRSSDRAEQHAAAESPPPIWMSAGIPASAPTASENPASAVNATASRPSAAWPETTHPGLLLAADAPAGASIAAQAPPLRDAEALERATMPFPSELSGFSTAGPAAYPVTPHRPVAIPPASVDHRPWPRSAEAAYHTAQRDAAPEMPHRSVFGEPHYAGGVQPGVAQLQGTIISPPVQGRP